MQIVMPFIHFCLKSLEENVNSEGAAEGAAEGTDEGAAKGAGEGATEGAAEGANFQENIELKVQLKTLKNSLTIMNHFKMIGVKEESSDKKIHRGPPIPDMLNHIEQGYYRPGMHQGSKIRGGR